jgi:hypothetical protein
MCYTPRRSSTQSPPTPTALRQRMQKHISHSRGRQRDKSQRGQYLGRMVWGRAVRLNFVIACCVIAYCVIAYCMVAYCVVAYCVIA